MAGKTYALMKLREIINGLNQIDADYHRQLFSHGYVRCDNADV